MSNMNEVDTNMTVRHSSYLRFETARPIGRRVLLVGVEAGDPVLRPGATGTMADKPSFGTQYDENVEGLRFFDSSTGEMFGVRIDDIKLFINTNQVVNAHLHISRPFIVTMTDGGRYADLPRYNRHTGACVLNDSVIIDASFEETPLLIYTDGTYKFVTQSEMISMREFDKVTFYNF